MVSTAAETGARTGATTAETVATDFLGTCTS
jgi:hypothetical protein